VNSLKEQNDKLQKQMDKLIAVQEAQADEEEKEGADTLAKAEEDEKFFQTKAFKDEMLAMAKQMANKKYDCAGLFYSSDGKLLKKRGYEEDLRQPNKDVTHYVDLFKTTLASYPKVEFPPSLVKFNEIAEQWANDKKKIMEQKAMATAAVAGVPSSASYTKKINADLRLEGKKLLAEIPALNEAYMRNFLTSLGKLIR
jgi:hypothetical protein